MAIGDHDADSVRKKDREREGERKSLHGWLFVIGTRQREREDEF
jgi:hypothetical protein